MNKQQGQNQGITKKKSKSTFRITKKSKLRFIFGFSLIVLLLYFFLVKSITDKEFSPTTEPPTIEPPTTEPPTTEPPTTQPPTTEAPTIQEETEKSFKIVYLFLTLSSLFYVLSLLFFYMSKTKNILFPNSRLAILLSVWYWIIGMICSICFFVFSIGYSKFISFSWAFIVLGGSPFYPIYQKFLKASLSENLDSKNNNSDVISV